MLFPAFAYLVSCALAGSMENLIASADGATLYYRAPGGYGLTQDYQLRRGGDAEPIPAITDISADGLTRAITRYGERYCGFAGSTCFLAAPCQASFAIEGPGAQLSGSVRQTFLRLDRGGLLMWIEQASSTCNAFGFPPAQAPLNGLYRIAGPTLIAAAGQYQLADKRAGLRMITSGGEVLVRTEGQLLLLGARGVRTVPQRRPFVQAAMDERGIHIVYTEDQTGILHWVDLDRSTDEELPFRGEQPMLSDDGAVLAFLSDGEVKIYQRITRTASVAFRNASAFMLSGNGKYVFAATASNAIRRMELATAETETWLRAMPTVRSASVATPVDPRFCPLICYTPPERLLTLSPGGLLVLEGDGFDVRGWGIWYEGARLRLLGKTANSAWLQIPDDAPAGCCRPLVLRSRGRETTLQTQTVRGSITCFSTWHEGFDRLVSVQDPARTGETVHVLLTGLDAMGPPLDAYQPLVEAEVLFLGPHPNSTTLQQLDLRILQPLPKDGRVLFRNSKGCELPPTAP